MTTGVYVLSTACSPKGRSSSYDASQSSDTIDTDGVQSADIGADYDASQSGDISGVDSRRYNIDGDDLGSGDLGADAESCQLPCEQPSVTGPQVQSPVNGEAILAIRTVATRSTSSIGNDNGCTVSWSGWTLATTGRATSACTAPDIDASGMSEFCAQSYECSVPYGRSFDGGFGCGIAWINLSPSTKTCEITVYSISGRQETFEVKQTGVVAVGYDCRTGTGQCIHTASAEVVPHNVTLSFAGVDGGSS
jgi:hypothetical protein